MKRKNLAVLMCVGVVLAVVLGSATHNYALWVPIGLVLATCAVQALVAAERGVGRTEGGRREGRKENDHGITG